MLPIHAAILFNAPNNVVEVLLDTYEEGVKCQDDLGMLPLHLLLRKADPNHEVVDMITKKYPDAVLVKDYKGRTPTTLADRIRTEENETIDTNHYEEREPSSSTTIFSSMLGGIEAIVESDQDDEVMKMQTNFLSKIYECLEKGASEREIMLRLEAEKFSCHLVAVLKEKHFEEMTIVNKESERHSVSNITLKQEVKELKRELKKSREQCDLYKTIMRGNRQKHSHTSTSIESMAKNQELILHSILRQRAEAETAFKARDQLIRDLLRKEEYDHSTEKKAWQEMMMETLNSSKPISRSGKSVSTLKTQQESDCSTRLNTILETKDRDTDDNASTVSEMTEIREL